MSTMTLHEVWNWHKAMAESSPDACERREHKSMADAIDAHLAKFTPDRAGYRQGLEDGKAEALAQPAQAVDVGADEWVDALAMPEGYELDEHLPGIWDYEYDREDGERMASATSWNHPALAAIAAWQEYTRALSGENVGRVGEGVCDERKEYPDGSGYLQVAFADGVPELLGRSVRVSPASPAPDKEG